MSNFILSSNDNKKVIAELKLTEGYSFSPKKYSRIKTVRIYDPKRIENVVITKYSIKYRRLAKIIKDLLNSEDAEESDYMICLDEIEKLKSILQIKYQSFLKRQMYEYFLNDLFFLENVLQEKIIEYRNSTMMEKRGR